MEALQVNVSAKTCMQVTLSPLVGQKLHQLNQVTFSFPRCWGKLEAREGLCSRGKFTWTANSIHRSFPHLHQTGIHGEVAFWEGKHLKAVLGADERE